jgi:hypothetical protein
MYERTTIQRIAVLGIAVMSLVAAVSGCTKTNAALLDQRITLARTCEQGVIMYTTPAKAPNGYQELALLNSSGNTMFTSEAGMMKSMRKKAASVGATGIILSGIDEPGAGAKVAGAIFGTGADRKGKSLAIYSASDTTRVRQACAQA